MQVARALSGLVEGGRLPTPHLFYASQDPATRRAAPLQGGDASRASRSTRTKLAIVKNGMWAVVNEPGGTAYGSRVAGLEMGGKTGTAQVVGPRDARSRPVRTKTKLQDHAWFAGFAPVEDPQIVVVVFVENGGHGNLAAAPLAKALFEAALRDRPRRRRLRRPCAAGRRTTAAALVPRLARGAAVIARVLPAPRRLDLVVLGCALALAALGVLFVASATTGDAVRGPRRRQAIWIAVGLGAMIAAILFDYRMLLKFSFADLLRVARAARVPALLRRAHRQRPLVDPVRPASSSSRPSSPKIATALLVAYLFENEDDARLHAVDASSSSARSSGIPFLLVFLQPDMGLALTFLPLLFVGLFFGGLPAQRLDRDLPDRRRRSAGGGWFFLKDYQKAAHRHVSESRTATCSASGYQVRQSKIAVGSGGFSGKGFRSGTQSQLRFLPVQHTDFILAVIAEEWGFLGVILVLGLFAGARSCAR